MINVYTLFSGSQGNCIYVNDGTTEILIDAGRSCGAIQKSLLSLGTSLENIKGIFVTHEHSDHTSALEVISKKYHIPVHMTFPSFDEAIHSGTFLEACAKRENIEYEKSLGNLNIRSFQVPHDSRQNVGYVISTKDDAFGIATDIGHLTDTVTSNLSLCNKVIVESNHDKKMVENGPYPQFLKERILSSDGHLSNDSCAQLVCHLCDKGVKEITLAHLSRENNTPKKAYDTVFTEMSECGFGHVPLKVAFADITVNAVNGKSYPFPITK